jgi:hypothetical protein
MRRGILIACALMVALTGCGGTSAKTSTGSGGSGGDAAGPPPGGWPQPVNGQLTTQMCGLLTNADYKKYGHDRLPSVSQKKVENQPNAISCMYMTSDELLLDLQPNAESAKLKFAATLKDHKERLTEDQRQSILAQNVVPTAEESWFDYWTIGSEDSKFKEYEIDVRRGALLVTITLSGLHGKTEADPKTLLSGLAGLVLQRIPTVGKTDTGKTQKVRFVVTGSGKAKQINYNDPSTSRSVELKNVKLPWHVDKPLISLGQPSAILQVNAVSGNPMAPIACSVSVDGTTVVDQRPSFGLATCMGNYNFPK